MSAPPDEPPARRPTLARRILFNLLIDPVVAVFAIWGLLVIAVMGPSAGAIRFPLLAAYGGLALWALVAVIRWRRQWHALGAFGAGFLLVLVGWSLARPSNDRKWQDDVAVLPFAEIDGDQVTVHNIRNFEYRSETDFTPRYYDRTFDLRTLSSVDFGASYWAGPDIAHIFLTFGFEDGSHLAASIETRKEVGESYSTINGFFRQYEIFYVIADERDVIRLRTNYRKDPIEDVYLYPVQAPPEAGRRLFLEYMRTINGLKEKPEFYNTMTTNCTTSIWSLAQVNAGRVPLSWKILLSGHAPEYLYEHGRLGTGLTFAELKERCHINARALAAGDAEDYSRQIRAGIPEAKPTAP